MAVSKAQNDARNKWDKEHMRNGSYKMRIEVFETFEKYCKDKGLKKNYVINQAVIERMQKDGYISGNINIDNIDV